MLEHIKEYGKEDVAVSEIRRITRAGGTVIIATPNSELLPDHGFSYEEIDALIRRHFRRYVVFENALVPSSQLARSAWEARRASGRVGTVITEAIRFDETVLLDDTIPETKVGEPPGSLMLGDLAIDTSLLHNTHSWVAVARKD